MDLATARGTEFEGVGHGVPVVQAHETDVRRPAAGAVLEPSLSDLHETSGTYEISVAKQGETGPLRQ